MFGMLGTFGMFRNIGEYFERLLGIELISATCGKVYNGTTDDQTHKRSLVLSARHSTSTSWRSDAPIILLGWEYHTRGPC